MDIFSIKWVGVTNENASKLLLSVMFILLVLLASTLLRAAIGLVLRRTDHATTQTRFWSRQTVSLVAAVAILVGLLSIWFNNPARLATAFGLMSAGLAFALQQVITAIAGYFVILRGSTFTVGDRISMGGVRGDVMRLGFIQTTIMEMGQPPTARTPVAGEWVRSRQFTGRIVTVSNAKIFAEPVYNYTRDFPFFWEEMAIPITYKTDRVEVEAIMLRAARLHAFDTGTIAQNTRDDLQRRFGVQPGDLQPAVYFRLTNNWLEMTVRFVTGTHGTRNAKDAMSRDILRDFDAAGICVASLTYDVVGFPTLSLANDELKARGS